MLLQPGTQFGRYEIQRRLGRGGMGTVYVAHDPVLGRMVAIKVFLGDLDLPDAAERFAREARAAAALNHANIVTIHDFGDYSGQPYIVMEYVQGDTLADMIKRKATVTTAEKLRLIEDLCSGVAYAHQVGVIHRDIKPTNLMIDRSSRLKILDFGIARMLGTLASNATALIGTPGYMAPEQILGGVIDHRSDLFSIGVVCYELLSYADAFPGETIHAITHRILSEDPVALTQLIPDVDPELASAVERALKKSPGERYADATEFRTALARVRRQMESDPGRDAASSARGDTAPPTIGRKPGTGSARQRVRQGGGVAEFTPPPDPRGGAREELVRRRTAQIAASLELGRALLHRGDLDAALDACIQALTLDDTHAGALELEQAINIALAKKRAGVLLEEARGELERGSLTAAQGLLQEARSLGSDTADLRRLERDVRLARVEQERLRLRTAEINKALDACADALGRSDVEAALTFARRALELDPQSERAHALEATAMRRLDEETGAATESRSDAEEIPPTMIARSPTEAVVADPRVEPTVIARRESRSAPTAAKAALVIKSPLLDLSAALSQLVEMTRARVRGASKRKKTIAIAAISLAVIAAATASGIVLLGGRAVPTGPLVIDAVPWATVAAVEEEDGTRLTLPSPASTPLVLNVPIGTYRIHLTGPPPASETRVVTIGVTEGVAALVPEVRFASLTPEEYFEQYLSTRNTDLPTNEAGQRPVDESSAPEKIQ